jgi:hypothetical protein
MPQLGAAGSVYARSVRPGKITMGALPDPEQIFESVMARRQYRKHPNNVSSILWYWASIIIHGRSLSSLAMDLFNHYLT